MTTDEETMKEIKDTAEGVLGKLAANGVSTEYGVEALQWLEQLLLKLRDTLDGESIIPFVNTVGAFLGECMCRTYDGIWIKKDDHWAVSIENGRLILLPFGKVFKLLQNGAEDSFVSMFTLIPRILEVPKQE